jgi:hypothetical protein
MQDINFCLKFTMFKGCIEFRLRPAPIIIQPPKGGLQTFEVDFSIPVANLIPKLVKGFGLSLDIEGYELQKTDSEGD